MEKYCPKCHKIHEDIEDEFCSKCGTKLKISEKIKPISPEMRHEIFVRDGYHCRECGKSSEETILEIEYISPLSKGGLTEYNLLLLCNDCNHDRKKDLLIENEIELIRNTLSKLENQLLKAESDLKVAKTEEDVFALRAKIKKLKKNEIPKNVLKLNNLIPKEKELKAKREAQTEENKRRENLFNKLYVELDDELLLELFNYFSLTGPSDEDNLRILIDKYEEYEIYRVISSFKQKSEDETNRNKLYDKLDKTLSSSELSLFMKEFSFQGSKHELLNYLIYNYSEYKINSIKLDLTEKRNKLIKKFNRETTPAEKDILYNEFSNQTSKEELIPFLIDNFSKDEIKEKIIEIRKQEKIRKRVESIKEKERQITHLKEILTFNAMTSLCSQFNIPQKYYVKDFIKELEPLNPKEVNKIYISALEILPQN